MPIYLRETYGYSAELTPYDPFPLSALRALPFGGFEVPIKGRGYTAVRP